jgi:hypothetical protein
MKTKFFLSILFLLVVALGSAFSQETATFITPTQGQTVTNSSVTVTIQFNNLAAGQNYNARINVDGAGSGTTVINMTSVSSTETITWLASSYSILQNLTNGNHTIEAALVQTSGGTGEQITPRPSVTFTVQLGGGTPSGLASVGRNYNLIEYKGSQLGTNIIGVNPTNIVAYKFTGSWVQVPVQIDEVVVTNVAKAYNNFIAPNNCDGQTNKELAATWNQEFYADPNTYIGADTDPTFDANDELVLEYNLGAQANGTLPNGVDRVLAKLRITDPLNSQVGYVYLFEDTSSPNPSAGVSNKVTQTFSFSPNFGANFYGIQNYKTQYSICNGSPTEIRTTEQSTIGNSNYQIGFSNRVRQNTLRINSDGSGLDTDFLKVFESSNHNNRAINHYELAKGNIVTMKQGVLRTIRSMMGTSSGVYNQLDIIATEYGVEYRNKFRVHGGGTTTLRTYREFESIILSNNAQFSNNKNLTPRTFTGNSTTTDEEGGIEESWAFFKSDLGNIATIYRAFNAQGSSPDYGSYFADNTSYDAKGTDAGGTLAYGTNIQSDQCYDLAYTATSAQNPCVGLTPSTVPIMINTAKDYYLPSDKVQADAVSLRLYEDNPLQTTIESTVGEGLTNPSVLFTFPENNTVFPVGTSIEPSVLFLDNDGVDLIQLFVNGQLQQFINNPATPTTFSNANALSSMQAGNYIIVARINDGTNTTSDTITVSVAANSTPTIASVSGVINNQTYEPTDTINITVSASDSDGTISNVRLNVDNNFYAQDNTAPYNFKLFGLSEAPHTLEFVVTDNQGGVTRDTINIITDDGTDNNQYRIATADKTLLSIVPPVDGKATYSMKLTPDYEIAWLPDLSGEGGENDGNGILDPTNTGIRTVYTDELDLYKPFAITSDLTQYYQDGEEIRINGRNSHLDLLNEAWQAYHVTNGGTATLTIDGDAGFDLTSNVGTGVRGISVVGDDLVLRTNNSQLANVTDYILSSLDGDGNADFISPNTIRVYNPVRNSTTDLSVALSDLVSSGGNGVFSSSNNNDSIRVNNIYQKGDYKQDIGNNDYQLEGNYTGNNKYLDILEGEIFIGTITSANERAQIVMNNTNGISTSFVYSNASNIFQMKADANGAFLSSTITGAVKLGVDNTNRIVLKPNTSAVTPGYVWTAVDASGAGTWQQATGTGGASDGYIADVALTAQNDLRFTRNGANAFDGTINMSPFRNNVTSFSVVNGNLNITQENGTVRNLAVTAIAPVQNIVGVANQTVVTSANNTYTVGLVDNVDYVEQVASNGQTVFNFGVTLPTQRDRVLLFRNGVQLAQTDYTVSGQSTTITNNQIGVDAGDVLAVHAMRY